MPSALWRKPTLSEGIFEDYFSVLSPVGPPEHFLDLLSLSPCLIMLCAASVPPLSGESFFWAMSFAGTSWTLPWLAPTPNSLFFPGAHSWRPAEACWSDKTWTMPAHNLEFVGIVWTLVSIKICGFLHSLFPLDDFQGEEMGESKLSFHCAPTGTGDSVFVLFLFPLGMPFRNLD